MAAVTPLCLLLAGGKSRRMGGGDKNLIMLGDRPLLAHVIARAVPEGAPLVINANGDAARFEGGSACRSSPMSSTGSPGRWLGS